MLLVRTNNDRMRRSLTIKLQDAELSYSAASPRRACSTAPLCLLPLRRCLKVSRAGNRISSLAPLAGVARVLVVPDQRMQR